MVVGNREPFHLFLCPHGRMLPRWTEAFQSAKAGKTETTRSKAELGRVTLIWLRINHDLPVASQIDAISLTLKLAPFVVLSDRPSDEEALAAFGCGAKGYCNTHASTALLVQISSVVLQGGLWIGESLMLRLVSATHRIPSVVDTDRSPSSPPVWSKSLTEREKEVAITLAAGSSNKEIARKLDITERTVKAHVGAILEKLQVRDRLQLSLVVNGRSLHRP
jgi:two-component system, NarL family, nitrate/nitrite response regulator NarL